MIDLHQLDRFRDVSERAIADFGNIGDGRAGRFYLPGPFGAQVLCIIACAGGGWDHVSVSARNRCPIWEEMDYVKRLFFLPDETAMQLHVPPADHINRNAFCLHLWRPHRGKIPRPPSRYV